MTQPQEVLTNYQKLLANNNSVSQTSFSSMVLNNTTLQGSNNLVSKDIYTSRSKKRIVQQLEKILPLAFITTIDNNLFIAGDRDEPQPVPNLNSSGFFQYGITNLKKEADTISYNAIYLQRSESRFFKQIGVTIDPENSNRIIGGQLIYDTVEIPSAVPCTTALATEEPDSRYFIATGYIFEDNAQVVFFGETPEGIQPSVVDGEEFPYYVTYEEGIPAGGFLVSTNAGLPALRNLTSAGSSFFITRASASGLNPLDKYNVRVSKIVNGNEESFVLLPNLYEDGSTGFDEYLERSITSERSRSSSTILNGGILNIYGDLCIFFRYEYFRVVNYIPFERIVGFSDTSIKVVLGYANIRTKEVVNNYKTIELKLLSNDVEVEKESVNYPINWSGEEPFFVETVFVLQQGRIPSQPETNKVKFNFQTSHIVSNTESVILDYSNGLSSGNLDDDGFTIFDDAEYRLYTGNTFSVLPQDFFKLPIPIIGDIEDITSYFEGIRTFFTTTFAFYNGLKSYKAWLQFTDDLTIVLFIGRPVEIVEGQERIIDGTVLYITRTIEQGFGESFEEAEFITLETGVQQMLNLVIEL